MSQTIKIKRSTVLNTPTSLANGELAYSQTSQKLFIGRPGGTNSDIDQIGGKWFTDQLANAVSDKGILTASKALVVDSDKKINEFYVDNLKLDGNTLSITNTNGDLNLVANGTGVVNIQSEINFSGLTASKVVLAGTDGRLKTNDYLSYVEEASALNLSLTGLLNVDNIRLNGNDISTKDTNGNLTLTPDGTGLVVVNKTTGFKVAAGSESVRPDAATVGAGTIRYNTTSGRFEGVVGNAWTGLGGVIDIDQDTYITAEETSDDDTLRFYTAGSERFTINASGDATLASTLTLNADKVVVNDISLDDNTININGSTISATGNSSAGTLILDPAPAAGDAGGELIVRGNLQVTGTTTTVNSTVVEIADPVIEIGTSDASDSLDRGILARYKDGSAKTAFFGWDRGSDDNFTFIVDGTTSDAKFRDLKLTGSIISVDGVAPTAGQLLIGNGTNGDMELATLTQGDSLTITNTDGGIELDVDPAEANATQNINNAPQAVTGITVGVQYTIYATGDTDFTAIGAADNNTGTSFTATDVGTGTGTVVLTSGAVYNPSGNNVPQRGAASFASEQFSVIAGHVAIIEIDGGYF